MVICVQQKTKCNNTSIGKLIRRRSTRNKNKNIINKLIKKTPVSFVSCKSNIYIKHRNIIKQE